MLALSEGSREAIAMEASAGELIIVKEAGFRVRNVFPGGLHLARNEPTHSADCQKRK